MFGSIYGHRWPAGLLLLVLLCFLLLAGCNGGKRTPPPRPPQIIDIDTLLVLPFNVALERQQVGAAIRCPICSTIFVVGPVEPGSEVHMTEKLLSFLKEKTDYAVIPPSTGEGVRSTILTESVGTAERDIQLETARRLGAEAVVSGTIYRFRERVGARYSAETPASVAFGMHLMRVADGRLLWTGHYDKTQQPLSENLFNFSRFLKDGGSWLKVNELADEGFEEVMTTFPVE